ncbi:MAG: UDP-N-acetylglucosamine 2-epimerase, partial [Pseudomonas sp.]
GMGIENIQRLPLLSKHEFEESIRFKLAEKNLLITFHPVTLEDATAESQFAELLAALDKLEGTHLIFTKANSDTAGRIINQMIDDYASANPHKAVAFTSLGQLRYLSALQYVDAMVGNSSSGLAEAPSFKIGTINMGDRQKGRMKASSVIDCEPSQPAIAHALSKLYSDEFQASLPLTENPYGDGCPSAKIIDTIKQTELTKIVKKTFFDLNN